MKSLFATLALFAAVVAAKADSSAEASPAASTVVASVGDVRALTGESEEGVCQRAWMCTETGAIYERFAQCRAACGAPLGSGACESLEWGC